jgi:hypothetical protein
MFRGSRAWSQWGAVHRSYVLLACRKFWFSNIWDTNASAEAVDNHRKGAYGEDTDLHDLRHDADVPTLHRGVLRKGAKIDRSKLVALQTKESKAAEDNQMMAAAAAAEKAQAEAQAQAVTQAHTRSVMHPRACLRSAATSLPKTATATY